MNRAEENRKRRRVEESVGATRIHRFSHPPMGGGEAVSRNHPVFFRVENQVDGNAEEHGGKDGPSEKIQAAGHANRLGLGLGLSRWQGVDEDGRDGSQGTDGSYGRNVMAVSPLAALLSGGSLNPERGGPWKARPTVQKSLGTWPKTKTPGTQSLAPGVLLNSLCSKFL